MQKELNDLTELSEISENETEIQDAIDVLKEKIAQQEFRTFLSGKHDSSPAIVTITAGAGGLDAQDWASMLFRMYQRYIERKKWKALILDESFGEPGAEGRVGIKQVSFEVHGQYAYGFLRGEHGVHRLVRMSPFSTQGLRHTSFASVEVVPKINLAQDKEIEIRPEDLKIDISKASGPGGQNVNKRETAIRMTHIPSGIVAGSQSQRSQQQNKEKALEMLAGKLYQLQQEEKLRELKRLKGEQSSIEWGSQIRSYVLHPYTMVKDHRTQVETSNVEEVLDGALDEFIESEIKLEQLRF